MACGPLQLWDRLKIQQGKDSPTDSARARVRKMIREHPPTMKDDNKMESVPISWGPLAWLRTWMSVAMLGEGASA